MIFIGGVCLIRDYLILVCVIIFSGVFSLSVILSSLLVTDSGGGYNGLLIVLNIKSNVYNLDSYGFGAYSLPVWFIVISLLSWYA